MLVTNGGRVSTNLRTMKVGTRSSDHDFRRRHDDAAQVVLQDGWNDENVTLVVLLTGDGCRPAVAVLTLLIYSAK